MFILWSLNNLTIISSNEHISEAGREHSGIPDVGQLFFSEGVRQVCVPSQFEMSKTAETRQGDSG